MFNDTNFIEFILIFQKMKENDTYIENLKERLTTRGLIYELSDYNENAVAMTGGAKSDSTYPYNNFEDFFTNLTVERMDTLKSFLKKKNVEEEQKPEETILPDVRSWIFGDAKTDVLSHEESLVNVAESQPKTNAMETDQKLDALPYEEKTDGTLIERKRLIIMTSSNILGKLRKQGKYMCEKLLSIEPSIFG